MAEENGHQYPVQANGATNGEAAPESQIYIDTKGGEFPVDEQPPQSEWDRLWDAVQKNPEDFSSWEALLDAAEKEEGGLTKDSSAAAQNKFRTVYDHFLAKFPLCFGYWKKYADKEFVLEGAEKALEVYERGVVSIHNSVELWVQFCAFKIANFPDDEEGIRGIFERGAEQVGNDYQSHFFWDKYLEWTESKGDRLAMLKVLERVITIPLHHYAKYFEKYSSVCASLPVTDLVTEEEYAKIEAEIRSQPKPEGEEATAEASVEKSEEQLEPLLRAKIHELKTHIYMSTQEAVHKRWVYEGEIKRSYFHVKPLDESQLANWRRYLDFEEAEGVESRIYVLYERCLVPCALYEEFWQRYIRFVLSRNDPTGVRNVFIRATSIFVPAGRPTVRLSYAAFEEEQGHIDEARAIYQTLLQNVPGHLETLTKYAHFERRQSGPDRALEILSEAVESVTSEDAKAYLEVQRVRVRYNVNQNAEEARTAYQEAAAKYGSSRYLLSAYLSFEIEQRDAKSIHHTTTAWTHIKSTPLPAEDKRTLGLRYLDYLTEHPSTTIGQINAVDLEVHREFMDKAGEASRKRGFEGDDVEGRPIKQVRGSIGGGVGGLGVQSPATPVGYYPPTQPAQQGYGAYAGYGAQAYGAAYYGAAAATPAAPQAWDYSQQAATGY
ncbi:mRNA splicing protein [Fimicolochytrium jonesii]|uniref:mRNA splicing protein n=1 Tax=Fimicolochytrium jonesii TaxID=1396493 RepID=UPI0022FEEC2F|nr:mRNA splicing protein [Fimicolochytrium jonesii]KAI8820429.1 mRNA splicing protein [Fimicolochytrium jonesii]